MTKAYAINTAEPIGSSSPTEGDDQIRGLKNSVVEFLGVDHYMDEQSPYDEDDAGMHKKVTLKEQTSNPAQTADKGLLFTKNDGTRTELYWLGEAAGSSTAKKLTSNGKLNVEDTEAVLLSGNQTIEGVKNFGSIPTVESDTHPPTGDYQLTDKKYVDDKIAAIGGLFGSWASKSFGTQYTAETDGIVSAFAYGSGGSYDAYMKGETPVGTERTASMARDSAQHYGIMMPVKKNDTWKVSIIVSDGSTSASGLFFIPLGA